MLLPDNAFVCLPAGGREHGKNHSGMFTEPVTMRQFASWM